MEGGLWPSTIPLYLGKIDYSGYVWLARNIWGGEKKNKKKETILLKEKKRAYIKVPIECCC